MNVLEIAQKVARRVGLTPPTAVFASSTADAMLLRDLLNDMALRIAETHDWRAIRGTAIVAGDGATQEYALPSDYDRMLKKANVWSTTLQTPLTHIPDDDEWLGLEVQTFEFVINAWNISGGQMRIKPALETGASAQYRYMTDRLFTAVDGTLKTEADADTDTFRLDDTLLRLGMRWKYLADNQREYLQDHADYEKRLGRLIETDGGSTMIAVGRRRSMPGVPTAYPKAIVP